MTTIREGMVFGLMTPEEQKALKDAEAVEVYSSSTCEWVPHNPSYLAAPYLAYRIAPTPVEPFCVDPIVWRVLDKRWRWITGCGEGMAWMSKPEAKDTPFSVYAWGGGGVMSLRSAFSPGLIQRGTCRWQEAIAERPEDTP